MNITEMELVKNAFFKTEEDGVIGLGLMRCDFEDGGLANKFFPSEVMEELVKKHDLDLNQINSEVNYFMFEKFSTFEKIVVACHPTTRITDDMHNLFAEGETCNYWIRLIPERGSYNMYIKIYVREKSDEVTS